MIKDSISTRSCTTVLVESRYEVFRQIPQLVRWRNLTAPGVGLPAPLDSFWRPDFCADRVPYTPANKLFPAPWRRGVLVGCCYFGATAEPPMFSMTSSVGIGSFFNTLLGNDSLGICQPRWTTAPRWDVIHHLISMCDSHFGAGLGPAADNA